MRKLRFLSYALVALTIAGCSGGDRGELTGVQGRPVWFHPQPYGTIYVPTGSIHIGANEQDVPMAQIAPNKQVSIVAFYMDETEITNNEYRQFVVTVLDSIVREKMAEANEEKFTLKDAEGNRIGLNWDAKINEEDAKAAEESLKELAYNEQETYYRTKQLDVRKIIYKYEDIDLRTAARLHRKPGYKTTRDKYKKMQEVEIYPDTLVFMRDYTFSYNEPMTSVYFWHPKYDDYPVVGVNWNQAKAFCRWRTIYLNSYYSDLDDYTVTDLRLPTEYEWEYASRGGRDQNVYPWGGPYVKNAKGCSLANFKPMRGDYMQDGGLYPIRVGSYFPNDFGLYDMSGNVAEWTITAYAESANLFSHDLNPDYQYDAKPDEPETLKRKVIRGGSWKDIAHFINCGTRTYEYQDSANSYTGFRCVQSYIGRSNRDTK
ncbi:MAG: SUMF1/EgtB/PvdO family nonheme iron enzyme [Bacteroidota bacterium]|jgi:sulfatase modifying factor 1|nr:SUMF1/EgtB/PvdO family nonheme iron enzyme [Sphingobacteriales bacterium]